MGAARDRGLWLEDLTEDRELTGELTRENTTDSAAASIGRGVSSSSSSSSISIDNNNKGSLSKAGLRLAHKACYAGTWKV